MRLGDIIKFQDDEGFITFLEGNYLECSKTESIKKETITDSDWFGLYFEVEENGVVTDYYGSKNENGNKDIKINIIFSVNKNFFEKRNISEGKIYNTVTFENSEFNKKRVIIDGLDFNSFIMKIRTDELDESKSLELFLDVFNGISKNDKTNEIVDLIEIEESDSDSESEEEEVFIDKTEQSHFFEKRIPIQEKELSVEERKDQIIYDLRKNFKWDNSDDSFLNSLKNVLDETFEEHEYSESIFDDWYKRLNNLESKKIFPVLSEGIDEKEKRIGKDYGLYFENFLKKYHKSNISYEDFISSIMNPLRLKQGKMIEVANNRYAFLDDEPIRLLSNVKLQLKDKSSENTKVYTKSVTISDSSDIIKRPDNYIIENKKLKRMPPTPIELNRIMKESKCNLEDFSSNMNDIPYQYLLELDNKNVNKKLKLEKNFLVKDPKVSSLELKSYDLRNSSNSFSQIKKDTIQSIKNSIKNYIFTKKEYKFTNNLLNDLKQELSIIEWEKNKFWPDKYVLEIIYKRNIKDEKLSSVILNFFNNEKKNISPVEYDSFTKKKTEKYLEDIFNQNKLLQKIHKSKNYEIEVFDKEVKDAIEDMILSSKIKNPNNIAALKWNKIEKIKNKSDRLNKKLDIIQNGKYLRNASNNENPYYLYDIFSNQPTIPLHEILNLRLRKARYNSEQNVEEIRKCLINQWCYEEESKYFSIIDNDILFDSMDDDHGFGETANFVNIDGKDDDYVDYNMDKVPEDLDDKAIMVQMNSLLSYLFPEIEKLSYETYDSNFKEGIVKMMMNMLKNRIEWVIYQSIKNCKLERKQMQTQEITHIITTVFSHSGYSAKKIEPLIKKWEKQTKHADDKTINNFLNLVINHALIHLINKQISLIITSFLFKTSKIEFKVISESFSKRFDELNLTKNSELKWMYGYSKEPKEDIKKELVSYTIKNFYNASIQYWKYNPKTDLDRRKYNYNDIKFNKGFLQKSRKETSISLILPNIEKKNYLNVRSSKATISSKSVLEETKVKLEGLWSDFKMKELKESEIFEDKLSEEIDFISNNEIDIRCYKLLLLKILDILLLQSEHSDEEKIILGKSFELFNAWNVYANQKVAEKINEWIQRENNVSKIQLNIENQEVFLRFKKKFKDDFLNMKYFIKKTSNIDDERFYKNILIYFVDKILNQSVDGVSRTVYRNTIILFLKNIFKHQSIICGTLINERKNLELVAERMEDEASTFITKDDDDKKEKQINRIERTKHLGKYAKGTLNQATGGVLEEIVLESLPEDVHSNNYERVDGFENMYEDD